MTLRDNILFYVLGVYRTLHTWSINNIRFLCEINLTYSVDIKYIKYTIINSRCALIWTIAIYGPHYPSI